MKIKIFMSNGKVYEVSMTFKALQEKILNSQGDLLNHLTFINGTTALNPSHISSIEVVNA